MAKQHCSLMESYSKEVSFNGTSEPRSPSLYLKKLLGNFWNSVYSLIKRIFSFSSRSTSRGTCTSEVKTKLLGLHVLLPPNAKHVAGLHLSSLLLLFLGPQTLLQAPRGDGAQATCAETPPCPPPARFVAGSNAHATPGAGGEAASTVGG